MLFCYYGNDEIESMLVISVLLKNVVFCLTFLLSFVFVCCSRK